MTDPAKKVDLSDKLFHLSEVISDGIQKRFLLRGVVRAVDQAGKAVIESCFLDIICVRKENSMYNTSAHKSMAGRRKFLSSALITVAAGVLPFMEVSSAAEQHTHAAAKQRSRMPKHAEFAAVLRDLWIGHIFWVRNVSVSAVDRNSAAMKAAELRAVDNARSIAASIEPFYGAGAYASFVRLLAGHYGAVKAYLVATVDDDPSGQSTATQSLTSNAEQIATFLSKANPYLPKDAVNELLIAHASHHIQQIQELKSHNYESEGATWEMMKNHIYDIADATADALAKQFISRFS